MQEQSKQAIVKMQVLRSWRCPDYVSKDLQQTFAESEIQQYDLLHSDAHELAMQHQQQGHERDMAAQQAAQAQQSQQADQQHEVGMAAMQQEEPANAGQ